MQRDLKIGLSLGVLLIGVVGAFFFRREPPAGAVPPQLQTAEHLDEQIAEKRSPGPYILPPEIEEDPPGRPVEQPRAPLTQSPPQFELPDFLKEDDAAFQQNQLARNPAPPDPIRVPGSEKRTAPPRHNSLWETVPASAGSKSTANGRGEPRTHVIQPGDTLTGLASRYLGSQTRFQEIYQANRKVLPDPDQLPVGVTIQIPSDAAPAVAAAAEKREIAETKPAVAEAGAKRETTAHQVSQTETATLTNSSAPKGTITDIVPKGEAEAKAASDPPAAATEKPNEKRFTRVSRTPFAAGRSSRSSSGETEPAPKAPPAADASRKAEPPERAASEKGAKRYQIRKGDTLARIAQKVYGQSAKARDIYEANRDRLASPDSVREGLEIVLP